MHGLLQGKVVDVAKFDEVRKSLILGDWIRVGRHYIDIYRHFDVISMLVLKQFVHSDWLLLPKLFLLERYRKVEGEEVWLKLQDNASSPSMTVDLKWQQT